MKKIITIVGCGAVGASQLYHLVEQLINDNIAENFEIIIFEKSASLGRGIAYIEDNQTNILNRPAGTMSLLHNKTADFLNWLITNEKKWKNKYPNLKMYKLSDAFLPRSLFGMYIEDTLQHVIQKARNYRLKISFVQDEVTSIKKCQDQYKIETKNSWRFYSDIVILALGNLDSNKFGEFCQNTKYVNSPYPTKNLTKIPLTASVAILGSRLSAIDAALALSSRGHSGNITFIARNGYFPSIRSPYTPYKLKLLTDKIIDEYLVKASGAISLREIIKILILETELMLGRPLSLKKWFRRCRDLKNHLENEFEIYKSEEKIAWQNIFISLNAIIEKIWHELKDSDKELFHKYYKSKWMACRVGIPFQNAKKIYHLIANKQLSLITNYEIEYLNDKFKIKAESEQFEFDYVINSTGNCDDIKLLDSNLISSMLTNGLITEHAFGGIDVDFSTSRVINIYDLIENSLFVLGNLTSGAYFFTSVLELNIKHAFKISKIIASDFMRKHHEGGFVAKTDMCIGLSKYQESSACQ